MVYKTNLKNTTSQARELEIIIAQGIKINFCKRFKCPPFNLTVIISAPAYKKNKQTLICSHK